MHYHFGEVRIAANELGSGGFGMSWGHRRVYCNRLPEGTDFGIGYNWIVPQWPQVVLDEDDEIAVMFEPDRTYWFQQNGNDYQPLYGNKSTLTHDTQNNVFKFTTSSGEVWQFHDFEIGTEHQGQFKQVTTAGGQVTSVYSYNNDDRITEIRRSDEGNTESYLYEYLASGDNVGRLHYVTLRRDTGSGFQPIRRVTYTYYDGSTSFGSLGDLKKAVSETYNGSSWVAGDTYYYRYYKSGDGDGFEHGLKYALGPQAYKKMTDEEGAPESADNSTLALYADYYFEYDNDRRVVTEKVQGGAREYTFDRFPRPGLYVDGYNQWSIRTTETRPDSSEVVVYTNYLGMVLVKKLIEGDDTWIEYWQYNGNGDVSLHATPAAVTGCEDDAGENENELSVTLDSDQGLIEVYYYYDETTTDTGGVGVKNYLRYNKIKQGSEGTEITLHEYQYTEHSYGGTTVYPEAKTVVYQSDAGGGSDEAETAYSYTWHTDTVHIQEQTTTRPLISTAQNGPGGETGETRKEYFDLAGNMMWSKDERGRITYRAYDATTGALEQIIGDVDSNQSAGLSPPSGYEGNSDGLHLTTDYKYDNQGRTTQVLGPAHNVDGTTVRTAAWTTYSYDGLEVRTARGYATGTAPSYTYTLVNPVLIAKYDGGGHAVEAIQATRASTSGKLLATDSFTQSTALYAWCRLDVVKESKS